MSRQELITLARSQGATHYSVLYDEFYRPVDGQAHAWQSCQVLEGENGLHLGWWLRDCRDYPPESAVTI